MKLFSKIWLSVVFISAIGYIVYFFCSIPTSEIIILLKIIGLAILIFVIVVTTVISMLYNIV